MKSKESSATARAKGVIAGAAILALAVIICAAILALGVIIGVAVVSLMGDSSKSSEEKTMEDPVKEEKTMKAPGRDRRTARDDFERDPAAYFGHLLSD